MDRFSQFENNLSDALSVISESSLGLDSFEKRYLSITNNNLLVLDNLNLSVGDNLVLYVHSSQSISLINNTGTYFVEVIGFGSYGPSYNMMQPPVFCLGKYRFTDGVLFDTSMSNSSLKFFSTDKFLSSPFNSPGVNYVESVWVVRRLS